MARSTSRRRGAPQSPEEVLTLAQRLLKRGKPHGKWLLLGVVAGLLAVGGWGLYARGQAEKEERAGAALAQVRPRLSSAAANPETVQALEGLIRDHPGTRAAEEARLFRAHLLYQLKDYAQAAKAYEALLPSGDPGLDQLLAESLSYCYEAQGDYGKAAAVLKPLAEKVSGAFQGEVVQRLAWLLERAGDTQEAGRYWLKLVDEPPHPTLVPYLKEKAAAAAAPQ